MTAFKIDARAVGDGPRGEGTDLRLESRAGLWVSDLVLQGQEREEKVRQAAGRGGGTIPAAEREPGAVVDATTGAAGEAAWWPRLVAVVVTWGPAGFAPPALRAWCGPHAPPCLSENISDISPRVTVPSFSP